MAAPWVCVRRLVLKERSRLACLFQTHWPVRTCASGMRGPSDHGPEAVSNFSAIPETVISSTSPPDPDLSEGEPAAEKHRPEFRTPKTNPVEHRREDIGLFYRVPPDEQIFYEQSVRKQFLRSCVAFNEMAVMVRRPAVELFEYLNAANYTLPAIRYGLYGEWGCGKTTTLSHIVHRCAKDGWVLVHHPFFASSIRTRDGVLRSSYKKDRIDTPVDAAKWLKYFLSINRPMIKQLQLATQNHYTFTRKEQLEVGTSWASLISYAQERDKFACDVVGILVKEIKEQARQGKIKVLVALDGANALFEENAYIRTEEDHHVFYKTDQLSMVQAFRKLVKNDWNNAAVVCVIDKGACNPPKMSFMPLDILGQKGFEALDPFIPIEVAKYTKDEATNALSYLIDRKFIQHPHGHTLEGQKELFFLSAMNPFQLYNATLRW